MAVIELSLTLLLSIRLPYPLHFRVIPEDDGFATENQRPGNTI